MTATTENETIPCGTCGAGLAVAVGSERAQCPHCDATTEIPLALRRRVEQHHHVVEQVRGETRRLGDDAARHRHVARANVPLLLAILVFAGAVPAWIVAHGTGATATMPALAWLVALALTASPLLVIAVAVRRWRTRVRGELAAAREHGRCGGCGGPLELLEGAALLRCVRCGSTVVATPEQTERLESFARQRRDAADSEAAAAADANSRSLDGFNRGLAWLTDGPLGFGPFFAVTMFTAGLILFVAMAAAPGMLRAAWICLAVCGGTGLLGLVWGLVVALQRLFWARLLAASGPRWTPRWTLVRDAVGDMPAFAVAAVAGFGLLAASIWRDTSDNAAGAAVVMLALGLGLAFLVLVFAAARVLWAVAAALLRR